MHTWETKTSSLKLHYKHEIAIAQLNQNHIYPELLHHVLPVVLFCIVHLNSICVRIEWTSVSEDLVLSYFLSLQGV